jgi:RNA polymerase subunit RPABC4/transcription elongation factor Spt4
MVPILGTFNCCFFNYSELEIHEGGQASEEWWKMVSVLKNETEKDKIAKNLKEYCGLDTYAMYAIYKVLKNIIN